jgi:exodeoxyribonuclease VII small subunit
MTDLQTQTTSSETPVDQLTYEQAYSQLDAIVAALEGNELTLETAMNLYERGQDLIRRCTALLDQAELRIRQLSGEDLVDFEP